MTSTRLGAHAFVSAVVTALATGPPVSGGAPTGEATEAAGQPRASQSLKVTGYILGRASNRLVDRNARALTSLGVDGVLVHEDGTQVDLPDEGAVRLLPRAHTDGLRAELLVSNYSNRINDFDVASRATRVDRHPEQRDRALVVRRPLVRGPQTTRPEPAPAWPRHVAARLH